MSPEDSQLIAEYRNGKKEAFDTLVKRHFNHVYAFVSRLTNAEEDSADITQDVFVKVWKNLGHYRLNEPFKPWLLQIARNSAIDWLRKRKNIAFSAFDSDSGDNVLSDTLADEEELPDEIAARAEDAQTLSTTLAHLSLPERDVLLLYYEQELTFDEISKLLKEPLHTVKSRARRALIKLKGMLLHQTTDDKRNNE